MKKTLSLILIVFFVITIVLFGNFLSIKRINQEIRKFNYAYELYNRNDLCGVDITTLINKAIDNNEKYNVKKDKNGYYKENENSIKIEVKMFINNKTYPMEKIKNTGLKSFTEFFGEVNFKCTDIQYHHENGKISKMVFEATEY